MKIKVSENGFGHELNIYKSNHKIASAFDENNKPLTPNTICEAELVWQASKAKTKNKTPFDNEILMLN